MKISDDLLQYCLEDNFRGDAMRNSVSNMILNMAKEIKEYRDADKELQAKLAKAVEALQAFKDFDDSPLQMKRPDVFEQKVRQKQLHTLAELKGQEGD